MAEFEIKEPSSFKNKTEREEFIIDNTNKSKQKDQDFDEDFLLDAFNDNTQGLDQEQVDKNKKLAEDNKRLEEQNRKLVEQNEQLANEQLAQKEFAKEKFAKNQQEQQNDYVDSKEQSKNMASQTRPSDTSESKNVTQSQNNIQSSNQDMNQDKETEQPKGLLHKLKFGKLKEKRYWLPLLLAHLIGFAIFGYFVYSEEQYKKSINFTLDNLNQAIELNDPSLLSDIFNYNKLVSNTYETITDYTRTNYDLRRHIGRLPMFQDFNDEISIIILNIIKNIPPEYEFDKKRYLLPTDINEQLRNSHFDINDKLSQPKNNFYVLECPIHTIKWGDFYLQLEAKFNGNVFEIVKIYNLDEILKQYNDELGRIRKKFEGSINKKQESVKNTINSYINNPTCTASISESSGKKVMIIGFSANKNMSNENITSFGSDIFITLPDESVVLQDYFEVNRLFLPNSEIGHSWTIPLSESHGEWLETEKLFCTTIVTYVHLSADKYYQLDF